MGICCSNQKSNKTKPKTRSIAIMTEKVLKESPSKEVEGEEENQRIKNLKFSLEQQNANMTPKLESKSQKKIGRPNHYESLPNIEDYQNGGRKIKTSVVKKKTYVNEMGTFQVEEEENNPFSKNVLIIPHKKSIISQLSGGKNHRFSGVSKESLYQKFRINRANSPDVFNDFSPLEKFGAENRRVSKNSLKSENFWNSGNKKFTISDIKLRGLSEELIRNKKRGENVNKKEIKKFKFEVKSVKNSESNNIALSNKGSSLNKQSIEDKIQLERRGSPDFNERKMSKFSREKQNKKTLKRLSNYENELANENFMGESKKLIFLNSKTKKELTPASPFNNQIKRGRSQSYHVGSNYNFQRLLTNNSNSKSRISLLQKKSSFLRNDIIDLVKPSSQLESHLSSGNKNGEIGLNLNKKRFVALAEESADLTDTSSIEAEEWRQNRKYSIAEKFENKMKSEKKNDQVNKVKEIELKEVSEEFENSRVDYTKRKIDFENLEADLKNIGKKISLEDNGESEVEKKKTKGKNKISGYNPCFLEDQALKDKKSNQYKFPGNMKD